MTIITIIHYVLVNSIVDNEDNSPEEVKMYPIVNKQMATEKKSKLVQNGQGNLK